jgi:dolichol-phosphate mannosyltransferase
LTSPTTLSVVVPCFNEESNARRFGVELFDPITRLVPNCEFLLIDDGSSDGTAAVLDGLAQSRSDVRVIRHSQNLGLGSAIISGLNAVHGDAVLTLDADLTFHPGEFSVLLAAYHDGVDAVLGSPMLGRMEHVPFVRKILSHGANVLYLLALGRKVTAMSSIFRLYRASVIKKLSLESRHFGINAEIMFKLIQAGGKFVEVPVTLLTRTAGVSKISTIREIRGHFKLLAQIVRWRLLS